MTDIQHRPFEVLISGGRSQRHQFCRQLIEEVLPEYSVMQMFKKKGVKAFARSDVATGNPTLSFFAEGSGKVAHAKCLFKSGIVQVTRCSIGSKESCESETFSFNSVAQIRGALRLVLEHVVPIGQVKK